LPVLLALDLDMIEPVRQRKALDLGALDSGCAVGHQRQLHAERFQGIDGVMRAREDEHLLFAIGGEAVGKPYRKIMGEGGLASGGKHGKSIPDDLVPCFGEFQSPSCFPVAQNLRAESTIAAGPVAATAVQIAGSSTVTCSGNLGAAIGRWDGLVHVDQHRAG
jgi:hypothetical protein